MFGKVLVAVDGSPNANRAVEMAGQMAQRCGAQVLLVHVIPDMKLPKEIQEMIAAGEITASRQEILETSAELILCKATERLAQAGVTSPLALTYLGDPATRILECAAEQQVDVIVLGHRGFDTQTNLLGSVSRKLLNTTGVTCLVVS